MPDFAALVQAFLADLFRHEPVFATAKGEHRHDGRWPDLAPEGRRAELAMLREWEARIGSLHPAALADDARIDRDLLLEEIGSIRFEEEVLRPSHWNPLGYVHLAGEGLFGLLARDFAPKAVRLASFAGRLEGLPALLAAARENLSGLPGRPVSRLHTEHALKNLVGVGQLIDEAKAQLASDAFGPPDPGLATVRDRLEAAEPAARTALEVFRVHLADEVLPRAEGEGRLGRELFTAKLRHTLRSELDPEELLARAERDHAAVRAELVRLAGELWPAWVPDRPRPDATTAGSEAAADSATVRGVLDRIAGEHPAAGALLDFSRAEVARLEAWVRERELLEPPDEPLEIIWTPLFLRSLAGAYLDSPGPLDTGQKSFFGITPPPDDATTERVESMLREDNARMLRLLAIHEAIPGHYLQLARSNRDGTLTRSVFSNGAFVEGWAVYVTQVLMDLGYGDREGALMLTHWKFYLRAITNAILDLRIHGGAGAPLDETGALALMIEGGFQEEHEARSKWDRARLTATQLSTYYVGSTEMWEIEREARRRAALAAGSSAPIPEARVVGDLGETPGFSYPAHLAAVLCHGSPPTGMLRRILFGTG